MTTHSDQAGTRWDGVGYGARLAGFLGLAPFGLALLCVTWGAGHGYLDIGRQLAIAWGAVILTFVAAVHWGLALAGRWQWSLSTIVGSTLPSVVGALAVLPGGERGLALRRALTLGVCTLLVLVAFASAEATAGSIQ